MFSLLYKYLALQFFLMKITNLYLTLEVPRCTNLCRALHFSLYLKNALQLKPDFSRF